MITLETRRGFLEYPSLKLWSGQEKYVLDFNYGGVGIHIDHNEDTLKSMLSWKESRAVALGKLVSLKWNGPTPDILREGLFLYRQWYGLRLVRLLPKAFTKERLHLRIPKGGSWEDEDQIVIDAVFYVPSRTKGSLSVVYDFPSQVMRVEALNKAGELIAHKTEEGALIDLDFWKYFTQCVHLIMDKKQHFRSAL